MGTRTKLPSVYPPGWLRRHVPSPSGRTMEILLRDFPSGLRASYAIEEYDSAADNPPLGIPGVWKRLVISRQDDREYPSWDAMRDLVRTCGFFDRTRDVAMLIPPDEDYVNVRHTAFHWWQKVTP